MSHVICIFILQNLYIFNRKLIIVKILRDLEFSDGSLEYRCSYQYEDMDDSRNFTD